MISASHMVVYTRDAEKDRAFFRDVLRMPSVDAGGGWMIFSLPPAQVGFHPADENDAHQLYLICEDIQETLKELAAQGLHHAGPTEQDWGITTAIELPGGGSLGLYQPKRPMAVSKGRRSGSVHEECVQQLAGADAAWGKLQRGSRSAAPLSPASLLDIVEIGCSTGHWLT